MNTIASFRLCTLTDEQLIDIVDKLTDEMYQKNTVPDRHVPARPDKDYDLLVGELMLRFKDKILNEASTESQTLDQHEVEEEYSEEAAKAYYCTACGALEYFDCCCAPGYEEDD